MTLEVEVRHRFGDFALDARFVGEGGVTALFGRSGSGKTSLVNVIAGLVRPDRGRVAIDGEERSLSGRGNGLISGVIAALADSTGPALDVADYSEHAIGHGAGAQAVDPARGDFGVAVEQHHVAIAVQRHALVHARDEPGVPGMGDERDARIGGQPREPWRHLRLGASVVDDHHLVGRERLGRDGVERLADEGRGVVERDHDRHLRGAHRPLEDTRRVRPSSR